MLARLDREPMVLRPFHRAEVLTVAEAAALDGRSFRTVRERCQRHDLGRRIGGCWAISKVAYAMWLDNDKDALRLYLEGDRTSADVVHYFERLGTPLPRQPRAA